MWKTFSADNNIYMLKYTDINGTYKIYISDLKELWFDEYDKEKLIQTFQECNPTILVKIEESEETLFQVLKFFSNIDQAEVSVTKCNDKIDVNIKTEISGLSGTNFNIKYKLTLTKADQNEFKEEITVPMIFSIHYLEDQKKMLCKLIEKKDRELEEYKMEKGLISREDLTTEKFNSDAVCNSSEKLMLDVYSQSNKFWKTFTNVYGDIEEKVMDVNVDSWNNVKKKKKIYNAATAAKRTKGLNILYKEK